MHRIPLWRLLLLLFTLVPLQVSGQSLKDDLKHVVIVSAAVDSSNPNNLKIRGCKRKDLQL